MFFSFIRIDEAVGRAMMLRRKFEMIPVDERRISMDERNEKALLLQIEFLYWIATPGKLTLGDMPGYADYISTTFSEADFENLIKAQRFYQNRHKPINRLRNMLTKPNPYCWRSIEGRKVIRPAHAYSQTSYS